MLMALILWLMVVPRCSREDVPVSCSNVNLHEEIYPCPVVCDGDFDRGRASVVVLGS
jgi:hypothetical protein